jgi:nickel/cobalt transporter (NicO) family protein
MSARRALGAALVALVACLALLWPAGAGAHPLGNFSTNQLVQVRIDERQASIAYVLDQAEIPTFQQIQRYDADGDGTLARAERAPLLGEVLGEASTGLSLTADGRPLPLGEPRDVELSFPPGQSGLFLTRVEAEYAVRLPRRVARVELANDAFGSRVGWRAVQIVPGEGTQVTSSASASDPTSGLRTYPENVLASPPDERSATFDVEQGDGTVIAPGPDGEPVTTQGPPGGAPFGTAPARATADPSTPGGFAGALTDTDAHGLMIILLLGAAFGWGALHALSPGHGKAMIAGYLVGSRGTPRDALILGATVTVTHTAAVFAFGLVTLAASEYIVPERLYPWLGLVSGLMVIAIGFAVMRSRFRRWRALRAGGEAEEHHHHHNHHHDHGHSHDHHHQGERPGLRGLIGLGVSGGLVPCPSALVVLIAAISQHRVGLGMVLIGAFSLGLAATVSGVGLAVIWGQRLVRRVRPERRLFGARFAGALPAISAAVIVLAGVLISYRAIPELG